MPAPGMLAGVIADDTGHGLADLWLTLEGGNADRLRFSLAQEPLAMRYLDGMAGRTDDLGRFAFGDLAPGQYTLTVQMPGRTQEHRQTFAIGEGETLDTIAITLPAGLVLEGIVLDPDDRPVSGAHVWIMHDTLDVKSQANTVSLPDGSFHFSALEPGTYRVHADTHRGGQDGLLGTEVESVPAGTKDLRLVMPRAQTITGVVCDSSGAPVQTAVLAFDDQQRFVTTVWTDDRGAFTLSVAAGSKVTLKVVDGDRKEIASLAEVAAGSTRVVLRIAR